MARLPAVILGIGVTLVVYRLLGGRPETWWPRERGRAAFLRSAVASLAGFLSIVVAWSALSE